MVAGVEFPARRTPLAPAGADGAHAIRRGFPLSADRRSAVLAEARQWLGTPYRHAGRIKGRDGGCDCLTLLAEVYARAGITPPVGIPFYPPDWHLHRCEERYAAGLLCYARPVAMAQPGDIALFRFGRAFAHGAIVTAWPLLIHAWNRAGVVEGDATQPALARRPVRFFSAFAEEAECCGRNPRPAASIAGGAARLNGPSAAT